MHSLVQAPIAQIGCWDELVHGLHASAFSFLGLTECHYV